ncbi:hypothetical protein GZ77_26240 [Endozoicomonas montiporae]|uniref:Uncharacterized protein n=1 Tax=Endozoicomonas montiporae TaxID=1027273 RepID=A0A081MYG7_9GAMM|nr:hypothetical protein [Endozoicomonas montiporae]KEQ11240.1 hypothetical protein GZ77_26435 [Endozoicomonas montiporae]KEQ11307.1 hypothetical protein GZ77_26240 [Endozoicomonas montiporae]
MLIIGLVGGTPETRIEITTEVMELAPSRICCYMMTAPESGMERVKALDSIVCDLDPRSRNDTMILTHVQTPEEVELIRSIEGFIWHVDGRPSDVIAAEKGDLWVSSNSSGGIWMTPEEAYSESTMTALRCAV